MAIFKKILVPYDGSQASRNAAEKSVALAADQGAELIAVKVVAFEGETIAPSDRLWSVIVEDLQQKARATLAAVESLASEKGIDVTLEVKVGFVEEEIVSLAGQLDADLIVLGIGEKSGFHRVSLRRLVKDAPCPVMMTR